MSSEPDNQAALPLEELSIAPAWVKAPAKSFDKHPGEERGRGRDRERRPDGDRRPDRDRRPPGPKFGPAKRPGPPRREEQRRTRPGDRPPAPRPAPVPVPPPVEVTFTAEEKALAAMIETVKQSGRAYAYFDVAKLILNKPERHAVKLTGKAGPLYRTLLVENVFLSQDNALRYLLRQQGGQIFKETRKPVEPPKGNFQFVNRCGLTGEWLGPPNYHEYQAGLIRHHQQRLGHVPFEQFKARIETVRELAAVQAWVESRSSVAEFTCLLDAEPQTFPSRDDLEKHVREKHLDTLVTGVKELRLSGPAARQIGDHRILEAIRQAWEAELRFPLKTANELRPRLVNAGLHFFKHGKGITYICKTKPNRFESIQHLTEHVQKIITFLRANEGCTRKALLEHLGHADETLLFADLHWLIQDGYVIEFYDGRLWALGDRLPKPAPSAPPPVAQAAPAEVSAPTTPTETPAL